MSQPDKTTNRKEIKQAILFLAGAFAILIIMHGNEIGTFQDTDATDGILWMICYIVSLPALFFIGRRTIQGKTAKVKWIMSITFIIVAAMPMFLLAGLVHYIDYYTSNKTWKPETVVVEWERHLYGKNSTTYYYTLRNDKNARWHLSSTLPYDTGQLLKLNICTTRLGTVVAEIRR